MFQNLCFVCVCFQKAQKGREYSYCWLLKRMLNDPDTLIQEDASVFLPIYQKWDCKTAFVFSSKKECNAAADSLALFLVKPRGINLDSSLIEVVCA